MELEQKIKSRISVCNQCYTTQAGVPLSFVYNKGSQILVVTGVAPDSFDLTKTDYKEQYIVTQEYSLLANYFGADWLTRSVYPMSHTFSTRCRGQLHDNIDVYMLRKCKMHTVDIAIGFGFKAIVFVGNAPKRVHINKLEWNKVYKSKAGRFLLAVKHPMSPGVTLRDQSDGREAMKSLQVELIQQNRQ